MWSTVPLESPWFVDFDGIAPHNRALRIIGKYAEHLKQRLSGWRAGVEPLLVQVEINIFGV